MSNKRVEVIIGSGSNQISLDLTANAISIALQYSIDDIREIDKKNSNHSKTITLPGTKKNNNAFGSLFDVNATFDQFNPNLKVTARIVVDSSPVLEGYIQLTEVKKLNNADLQGNLIQYNVVVFDNSIDFIQTLGDKLIAGNADAEDDLDFSVFDHVYDKTAIENAWTGHTYEDIYQYPLLDTNKFGYVTTDFKPAFYHKGLLLKIADVAGYTLSGSFIETNTQYDKEIIAWDGNTPKINDTVAATREFKAGFTASTVTIGTGIKSGRETWNDLGIINVFDYDDVISDGTGLYQINQAVTGGIASTYEVTKTGTYDLVIQNNIEVEYSAATDCVMYDLNTNTNISDADGGFAKVRASLFYRDDDSFVSAGSAVSIERYESFLSGGTKTMAKDSLFTFPNLTLTEGREVYVKYYLNSSRYFSWRKGANFEPVEVTLKINNTLSTGAPSVWFNEVVKSKNIVTGDVIEVNSFLPKGIKQKDLFADIIRRYNVYIRRHPTAYNTLILETRDDFYANNVSILDWTQKKDYSSEDSIQFLSELQNKEILFTYKEANDLTASDGYKYNETYLKSTGDLYGQKKVEFQNEFVKGTKEIESIFSTAPLLFKGDIGNNVVVPSVSTIEGKRKPVLLYWGGLIPVQDEYGTPETLLISWSNAIGGNNEEKTTYPYAGHYDNPINPSLDIHYGDITYEFYGKLLGNTTDNNLFNNYWRNYIEQISTGKLVTSKFYLNETDINFIKDNLNSRIFVKDSYYVINKIVDYKPLEDGLTKVELLRIEQGSTFTPETGSTENIIITEFDGSDSSNSNSIGPFRSSVSNIVNTPNAVVVGEGNYVGPDTTGVVTGNNNNIGGDVTNVNVTGNDNVVEAGISNVTIVGDGITVTESNTSVINGSVFTPDTVLSGLWEAGTGLNSVAQVNTGTPNIASGDRSASIAGFSNSTIGSDSGIIAGANNSTIGFYSFIGGGLNNNTSASNSTIVGGDNNVITTLAAGSAILGGTTNTIDGANSASIAGSTNTITTDFSITGGFNNTVSGIGSQALGITNTASGFNSTAIGGNSTASGGNSIAMGSGVTASGLRAVAMGGNSVASAESSFALSNNSTAAAIGSGIFAGTNNAISVAGINSSIIGGVNINLTTPNTVAVPAITFGNEDVPWKFIELDIGDWDMDATGGINVAHGLSATEWKTVRQMDAMIRNDADGVYFNLNTSTQVAGTVDGSFEAIDSTNFSLSRTTAGFFDDVDFDATTYNRGFITFWYKPD